ncbi:ABC transporter permease [Streptomyces sp. NPDC046727]|uniref:ABC transporter permease n=1 Tax=Streptomyces sp. NPDC046727 TaxID=3155373 RepID=UPI003404214E
MTVRLRTSLGHLARAWLLELRVLSADRFFVFLTVVLPLVFASIGHFMFQGSHRPAQAVSIALSAGLMGMWSTTLLGAGSAITRLRHMGVLEPLVASPTATMMSVLPFMLASATGGVYSLFTTLTWSALLFHMPLQLSHPLLLILAVVLTVLSVALLGMVLACAFILYPTAQSLANLLEYPIWMLSGMLVPIDRLPGAFRYVSYCLAPTWGVKSVLGAALDADPPYRAMSLMVIQSVIYVGLACLLLRRFEWLARKRGTLALQ